MQENTKFFSGVVKGALTSIIVTLVGVLIFAFIIKTAHLESGVIKAVNQFIKVLSVFLGCFFCIKEKLGAIKGLLLGVLSTTLTFALFSLIGAPVDFELSFIIELIFGAIVGAISGIITVNVKKHA